MATLATGRDVRLATRGRTHRAARRRHGRRRPAGPDDPPGRDRARPVAARARRSPPTTAPRWSPRTSSSATTARWPTCGPSRPAATSSPSTTSTCPTSTSRALAADGVAVRPGAAALRYAQDKALMRARLDRARRARARAGWTCRDGEHAGAEPRSASSATRSAGRSCSRPPAAATTARACGSSTRRRGRAERRSRRAPRCSPRSGSPIARELAAVVARSPFGQGAAWPVVETVQQDGICVEVIAPAPACPTSGPTRRRRSRCGSPPSSDVTGVLAVELFETTDGTAAGQRAGDASAQLGALDDRGRAHLAVRAAPARGARLPARRDRADRAGHRDGQPARRPDDVGRRASTSGCITAWRAGRT